MEELVELAIEFADHHPEPITRTPAQKSHASKEPSLAGEEQNPEVEEKKEEIQIENQEENAPAQKE